MTEYTHCLADCGQVTPGLALSDDRQLDYPERDTTIGQANIETVLLNKPIEQAVLLHVGIGNSQLAEHFCPLVKHIDGVTMGCNEQCSAQRMGLPNYRVMQINKYSSDLQQLNSTYDFIIDNNIFSYACCKKHFMQMMQCYTDLLKPSGELLTERRGLHWIYRKPEVIGMSYVELETIGRELQLTVGAYSNEVFYLRKAK